MFRDCNVLHWLKEEWTFGPDSDYYDDLEWARWAGNEDWSDIELLAASEAREAWQCQDLDTRPLEQRPYAHPPFRAPCRRWQAVVDAHTAQELGKWDQQVHSSQEQHARAALKKQKRE
jgi:hypothetical protein